MLLFENRLKITEIEVKDQPCASAIDRENSDSRSSGFFRDAQQIESATNGFLKSFSRDFVFFLQQMLRQTSLEHFTICITFHTCENWSTKKKDILEHMKVIDKKKCAKTADTWSYAYFKAETISKLPWEF